MPRQTKKIAAKQWFKQTTQEQDMFLFNINQQFWKAVNAFGIILPRKYSSVGCIYRDETVVLDAYTGNGYRIVLHIEDGVLYPGIDFGTITGALGGRGIAAGWHQFSNDKNPIREDGDVGEGLWEHLLEEHQLRGASTLEALIVDALNTHTYARAFIHFLGGEAGLLPRSSLVRAWQAHKIEYKTFKVTGTVYDDSSWFVDANVDPNTYNAQFQDLVESVKWINRT